MTPGEPVEFVEIDDGQDRTGRVLPIPPPRYQPITEVDFRG